MGTLLGFALGFYLGTKAGPEGIDELVKAWQTIQESEDFKALSATAQATVQGLIEQGGAGVANFIAGLTGTRGEPESERRVEAARNGRPQGLWAALSQSGQVQELVSTGAALVIQLLERGKSAAGERI